MRAFSVKLGRAVYEISREPLPTNHGECDYDEREIRIDTRCRGRKLLTTMIHEALHAQHPKWTEARVDRESLQLADMLWAAGARMR